MSEEMRNALPKGYTIQDFQVEKVLGAGGFGVTYLARDMSLDRRVAMKEYLPSGIATRGKDDVSVHPLTTSDRDDFQWGLERFEKEAKTLVAFSHPNIVAVYRFFKANGTAYLIMAYEDGESLAQILERAGTLTEQEILEILAPLLDGLEHVHNAGFLHRDIKPGNIYIRKNGQPVLLDFGAARHAMGGRSQSLTSIVSEGYAPFEQYTTHGNQGPWTDIYALGASLYRCVTGARPPSAPDRMRRDPYQRAVEAGRGHYSEALLAAIDAALIVDEEKRPQSIAAWRPMFHGAPMPEAAQPLAAPREPTAPTAPPQPATRPASTAPSSRPPYASPPVAPPRSGKAQTLGSGRPLTSPPTQPPPDSGPDTIPAVVPRKSRKGLWLALGIVAGLAVVGTGAVAYMEYEHAKKIEQHVADAKKKVEQARAAIGRKAFEEAETLLNEAQRDADAAKTKVEEIDKARAELKAARDAHVGDLRAAKARAIGEARVTIAEARVAVRARRLDDAENKLKEARAKLDAAAKLPGDAGAAMADAEREYAEVSRELNEARRKPPGIDIKLPDIKTGGMPQGAWPRDTVIRGYVDQSLRKLFPD